MAKGEELPFRSTLDDSDFEAKMRRMEATGKQVAGKVGDHLKGLAKPIAAIGPAIAATFTGGAIVSGVRGIFDAAEALGDLSDQTGVSVGRLAVFGKAFENAGLQIEDVGTAINKMQKALAEASPEQAAALTKLGFDGKAFKEGQPADQLIAIGDAISALKTPTERSTTAMALFGKSGGRLLAAFKDPLFAAAGGTLTGKAALLERNAELFAEAVAPSLNSVLDKALKVNLASAGQQFGEGVVNAAKAITPVLDRLEKVDWDKIAKATGAVSGFVIDDLGKGQPHVNAMLNDDARVIGAAAKALGYTGTLPSDDQKRIKALQDQVASDEAAVQLHEQELQNPFVAGDPMRLANEQRRANLARQQLTDNAAKLHELTNPPERVVITTRKSMFAHELPTESEHFKRPFVVGGRELDWGPNVYEETAGSSLDLGRAESGLHGGKDNPFNSAYVPWATTQGGLAVGASYGGNGTGATYAGMGSGGGTGNIWSQISGRVSGSDHMAQIAKHAENTAKHTETIAKGVSTGGGGGGGGGATVTK